MPKVLAGPLRTTSLVVLLRSCENKVRERLQPLLDLEQLSPEHWRVMALLHEKPGIGAGEIGSGAVLPSASVTRHVDKLVSRGLIVRRIDTADKRRVVLALSARGHEITERLLAEERSVEAEVAASLARSGLFQSATEL